MLSVGNTSICVVDDNDIFQGVICMEDILITAKSEENI